MANPAVESNSSRANITGEKHPQRLIMKELRIVVEIKASPERVLAEVVDLERWPQWTSTMSEVRLLDPTPLAIGKRAFVRQPKWRPSVWKVTDLNATSFAWETRSPGMRLKAGHIVNATQCGSRVELSLHFTGLLAPLIGRLYRRLSHEYLRIESESLRRLLEEGQGKS